MNYQTNELEILACTEPNTILNLALSVLDSIREDKVNPPCGPGGRYGDPQCGNMVSDHSLTECIGHNLIEFAIIKVQMMLECPHGRKVSVRNG